MVLVSFSRKFVLFLRRLKRRGETIESAKPPSTTYDDLADSSDDEDVPFLHHDKDNPDWRHL